MAHPTPPGDIPLIEGLGPEWNDIVGAVPEEMRGDIGSKLKERISAFEPLKQYEDFANAGIDPAQIKTSLDVFAAVENNPKEVYEAIGRHLGISTAAAKEMVEEIEEQDDGENPDIAALKQQVDTLAQIALAQRQQTAAEKLAAEQDAQLEREIGDIKKKYGDDVPEDEILMRMLHKGLTAEQAYQEYATRANDIRSRRPAPFVLGSGGHIPNKSIDPTKLNNKETKDLVAQMMDHANAVRKQ